MSEENAPAPAEAVKEETIFEAGKEASAEASAEGGEGTFETSWVCFLQTWSTKQRYISSLLCVTDSRLRILPMLYVT